MAKKIPRKKRSFTIHMDPRNYAEYEGLVFDFNTQQLMGFKNGENYPLIGETRLELKRERENKGPKILHASTSATKEAWFSTNHQLLSYDHLIAIDTNTNYLGGSSVSITAAYHLVPKTRDADSSHAYCQASVIALVECWNVVEKPENLGWWQILNAMKAHPLAYTEKIGLIVDSDLGNHQAFNDRSLPLIDDFYLPENVTIIYGSDKGGAEQLSTKMIRYCHDLASDLYKGQELLLNPQNLWPGLEGFYTHIRQWNTETGNLRPFVIEP